MSPQILALDVAGAPTRWIDVNTAAHYYATNLIAWSAGSNCFTLRGGTQRATGRQSELQLSSIVAIKGKDFMVRNFDRPPTLNKDMLLLRDRYMCAYCAQTFKAHHLDLEHIIPKSKGGSDSWMNLVAACKACNNRKADRTPEAAGMKLHYVPYVPNLMRPSFCATARSLRIRWNGSLQVCRSIRDCTDSVAITSTVGRRSGVFAFRFRGRGGIWQTRRAQTSVRAMRL